ncbi:unnamed protein product [Ectocarpus fasciculatus]
MSTPCHYPLTTFHRNKGVVWYQVRSPPTCCTCPFLVVISTAPIPPAMSAKTSSYVRNMRIVMSIASSRPISRRPSRYTRNISRTMPTGSSCPISRRPSCYSSKHLMLCQEHQSIGSACPTPRRQNLAGAASAAG